MERGLLAAVGGGMALFGGLMLAYFIGELTSGKSENTAGLNAGLVVFFGGMLAVGVYLIWRMIRPVNVDAVGATRPGVASQRGQSTRPSAPQPPTTDEARERVVLKLAEKQHGRVTIPEVAARCDLTIAEAKATLDRMVLLQVAFMQVTASGGLVYVFSGFLSDQDKAAATDF
jgi:hypothetical protein